MAFALLVALFSLSLVSAFIALRLNNPSDGARLEPNAAVWRPDGVIVTPLEEQLGGLRSGDRVVAIDGRTLEAWSGDLLAPNAARPRWQFGQVVTYTILRDGLLREVPVTLGRYPLGKVVAEGWGLILFAVVSQAIGTFVFLRRPGDPATRALFISGWSLAHTHIWAMGLQAADLVTATEFWLYMLATPGLWLVFWSASLHFALVFPRAHPFVTRRAAVIPAIYIVPYLFYFGWLAAARLGVNSHLEWLGRSDWGQYLPAAIYLALTVLIMVRGYRAYHDEITRQKIRWVIFGTLVSGTSGLALWILPLLTLGHTIIDHNAAGLLVLPYPLALAIAVLRYQLFDIDIIIRRTLIYGALTAALALVYFASVLLLQQVFRDVIGQGSDLAIVISTLTIAALFVPLHGRVQRAIDRRFYRRKYNAARTLAAFAATARDEVELERLTSGLVEVVEQAMQPAYISLWLRNSGRQTPIATDKPSVTPFVTIS